MYRIIRRFSSNFNIDEISEQINKFLGNRNTVSSNELKELRINLLSTQIRERVLDNKVLLTFLEIESPEFSHSIIKTYIESMNLWNAKPSIANYEILIKSYLKQPQLSDVEKSELSQICERIIQESDMILPSLNFQSVIEGLCSTNNWLDSVEYLKKFEGISITDSTYHTFARRAFEERNFELGFKYLLINKGGRVKSNVFNSYWLACKNDQKTAIRNLERMLTFIGENELLVKKNCIENLLNMFNEIDVTGKEVEMIPSGKCPNCQQNLERFSLSQNEFNQLREAFVNKVIYEDDIDQKTSEKELAAFKKFIEKNAPFDYVIDGLNIAYINHKSITPENLTIVTQFFSRNGKRVLMIGRNHLKKHNKVMNNVNKYSKTYFLQDGTHDDLFIIYAALYSGERCQIVSRDLMRSHSFLVGNLRRLFLKWQKRNHCLIKSIRPQVIYDPPQLFNANCHKVENYWHLPVDVTDTDSDKISLKQFWMDTNYYCLKIDQ